MKQDQTAALALALQEISLMKEQLQRIEAQVEGLLTSGGNSMPGRFSLCARCGLSYLTGRNHTCSRDEVEA